MSEFRGMTITFARNVTENGGDFHEITVDDIHAYRLNDVVFAFSDAGYEIVSVMIDGYDFQEDMFVKHIGSYNANSDVIALFDALCEDVYAADTICAFITVRACADVDNWQDTVNFSGMTYADVVCQWVASFHKVYSEQVDRYNTFYEETDPFPRWMEIDWEATLQNIAREYSASVVEFNGMVYYFG